MTATKFGRIQTGDIRDDVADILQSQRHVLTSGATTAKTVIRGEFEMARVTVTILSAIVASAKTVTVGTDATAARFVSQAVSAGAANDRTVVTPASGAVPNWVSTGSAQGVTTVKSTFTDVSAVDGTTYVTFEYYVRDLET